MRYSSRRMPTSSEALLVRAIGARQLTASIINVTIGAGIFVLPAAAAAGLGPAAPLAYIVCAALMALIVCCFAAARYPRERRRADVVPDVCHRVVRAAAP